MKLFGRERESLRIRKAKAARALFINTEIQEVEVRLITEDGERLDLRLPSRVVPALIGDLTDAYEAINPPLNRRDNRSASWDFDMGGN